MIQYSWVLRFFNRKSNTAKTEKNEYVMHHIKLQLLFNHDFIAPDINFNTDDL